jgi:hypothetical protein
MEAGAERARVRYLVDDARAAGVSFRNDVIGGPGGQQVLLQDPAGNFVELFQPAPRADAR